MRKLLVASVVLLELTGCVGLMMENRYMDKAAEPVPPGYSGAWTGTIGNYLSTIKLNPDGTGLVCNSWHTHNSVERLKYSAGAIYPQSGGSLNIQVTGNQMTGKLAGAGTYRFVKDDDMIESAPYCQKNM